MKRKLFLMMCPLVLAFFASASSVVGQERNQDRCRATGACLRRSGGGEQDLVSGRAARKREPGDRYPQYEFHILW